MKKNNKKLKLFSLIFLILFCLYFQTVVYSAISSKLMITGDAVARIRNNVRINKFRIHEVSDGVISSYEEFSKTYTMSNVTLPNSDSYIIYELVIGNYEDVEMQLSNITGLPSNLTYELIDYNLHDMICDNTGKCFGGVEKTLYLKIKYANYNASGTNYNINLEYEFKEFSNTLMVGTSFRDTIPASATHLVFTDEKPANGTVLTDVSLNKDMGVVGYLDGTIYKVSTRRTGVMPEANIDSSYMFNGKTLTDINLSNLDTRNVTNMAAMFLDSSNLINIVFGENFNTEKVNNMSQMFRNCSSIVNLDFSNFKTGNVNNFSYFLRNCKLLEKADVSNFDTSNVMNFYSMFRDCAKLSTINVGNFDTSKSTNLGSMFQGCSSVVVLDVSEFNTKSVTNMASMFENCLKVEALNVSNFDTSNVTSLGAMFKMCNSLISVDVSNWNTKKNTSLYGIFAQCYALTKLDLSSWDVSNVKIAYWVFEGDSNLIELNLSNWNFQQEVNFEGMFHGVSSIEYIDLSGWKVQNIINLDSMFAECRNLKAIDLSGFNTKNVTNFDNMFFNDKKLQKIYVGDGWDTSSVTSSDNMFYNCFKFPNYDANYVDVSKAYVGDGGYLSYPPKTFNIDGVAYKYEEGMTWRDWVDSSYDTRGFVNNNDLIYTDDLMYALVYEENNGSYTSYSWPYIDDLIDPNLVYVTFYEAGEDGEW